MGAQRHRLTARRDGHWETRDRRFALYRTRSDGEWRAAPKSSNDNSTMRAAGLLEAGALEVRLGLGLRETAAVVAGALGSDPRVRWSWASMHQVEEDGSLIPYSLRRRDGGWRVIDHSAPIGYPAVDPIHRTRADALDALADILAPSSEVS